MRPLFHWRAFFVVGEDRVLAEQLSLLLHNVQKMVAPRFPLVALLLWTLYTGDNGTELALWAAALIASKLGQYYHARQVLAAGVPKQDMFRLVGVLALMQAVDGVLWGYFPWIALDLASVPTSVMVFAILAVVCSNAMSVLSPVPLVFVAFATSTAALLIVQLWRLGDPAYDKLIFGTLLYAVTLFAVARNMARSTHASIELRFENLGLIERLRVSQRQAEDANLAKSKFLAAASHDLRQPIHSQVLFLDVLSRTALAEAQHEIVANIRSSTDATRDMLNTLLDFSRIEAGVIEPSTRSFRLQPLLNRIESDLAPQAVAKGLVFRVRETPLATHSDPALVELIARNLISNAIRYTERGGVLVACRARGSAIQLEVWDTGIGIEPAQQQEIFREFHQLGNPERDRQKGLGLGLAIADGLARTLHHRLELASRPGHGSVFRLSMPLVRGEVITDELTAPARQGRLQGVRVLVVDDDEAVRAGMSRLLQDWGCQCAAVESVEAALTVARTQPVDIVVSDYRLREQRTGAEAIAALRAQCGNGLPAILVTGDTAPERLREARASNVPLLHKPVSPDQLYEKMIRVLAG